MDLLTRWVRRQFTTRVIVLMPVAIAINVVLGATVQQGSSSPSTLTRWARSWSVCSPARSPGP